MKYAELLTARQVQHIHDASLQLLAEVGMLVRHAEARQILAKHGCQVDAETHLVRFPGQVIEQFRAAFPSTFTFYGRQANYDVTVPHKRPVIMNAGFASHVMDPISGEERLAHSDDLARIAHLVNELPAYDLFYLPLIVGDASDAHFSLARYYPALKNCLKPICGDVPNVEELHKVIQLGEIVAGGAEAYRRRPLITHSYQASVSPLTLDVNATEQLLYLAKEKLPGYATFVVNAGLTSPLTLIGSLTQLNAEFLATNVLAQMIQPEREVLYHTLPALTDMRTGAYTPGAIETAMLLMGTAQMARFYNVPSAGAAGLTNSKVNDAQSGYETGMSSLGMMLAGADLLSMGGLLDALMSVDYAKMVIDGEIALMLKRMARGYEGEDEMESALDVSKEVGPTGMFIATSHTADHMKTTAFLPQVANRDPRKEWIEKGAPDAHTRALQHARQLLTRANPAAFSPALDAQIRVKFNGLVAGDSIPPPEWKAWAEQQTRRQRPRKKHRRRRR